MILIMVGIKITDQTIHNILEIQRIQGDTLNKIINPPASNILNL